MKVKLTYHTQVIYRDDHNKSIRYYDTVDASSLDEAREETKRRCLESNPSATGMVATAEPCPAHSHLHENSGNLTAAAEKLMSAYYADKSRIVIANVNGEDYLCFRNPDEIVKGHTGVPYSTVSCDGYTVTLIYRKVWKDRLTAALEENGIYFEEI